jgi:hypothetical protein
VDVEQVMVEGIERVLEDWRSVSLLTLHGNE